MRTIFAIILALTAASPAFAYFGPGLGVGSVAAVIGTVGSLFLALVGIVWFPLKRAFKALFARRIAK